MGDELAGLGSESLTGESFVTLFVTPPRMGALGRSGSELPSREYVVLLFALTGFVSESPIGNILHFYSLPPSGWAH